MPQVADKISDDKIVPKTRFEEYLIVDDFYEFAKFKGKGNYSQVFTAYHKETGKKVAIKELSCVITTKSRRTKRYRREYDIAARLNHQNIVKYLDIMTNRNRKSICFIMEFCCSNLRDLTKKAPLSDENIGAIMHQLLKGVEYLHSKDIIHRDLKPSNLLFVKNGTLKIADFGFAIQATPSALQNRAMSHYGSPGYIAIELLLGSIAFTKAIDMWSVGCIFAFILRRDRLFNSKTFKDAAVDVIEICGSPKEADWPGVSKLSGMRRVDLPKASVNKLRANLPEELPAGSYSLLSKLLTYCPEKRITARKALKHKFFTEDTTKQEGR